MKSQCLKISHQAGPDEPKRFRGVGTGRYGGNNNAVGPATGFYPNYVHDYFKFRAKRNKF